MSYNVKSHIEDPFGWLYSDYGVWEIIEDYTNEDDYFYLDAIYRCLVDGVNPDGYNELKGMSEEQLKREYSGKFPSLMAECLENIAKAIRENDLNIDVEF